MIWLFILWYLCGVFGFIYFWTKDFHFLVEDLFFAVLVAGWIGPLTLLMYRPNLQRHSKILIRKRTK